MKHIKKGKKLKRYVAQCWEKVDRLRTNAIFFQLSDSDDDLEKLNAILNFVNEIERNCSDIRSYVRECKEYGGEPQ